MERRTIHHRLIAAPGFALALLLGLSAALCGFSGSARAFESIIALTPEDGGTLKHLTVPPAPVENPGVLLRPFMAFDDPFHVAVLSDSFADRDLTEDWGSLVGVLIRRRLDLGGSHNVSITPFAAIKWAETEFDNQLPFTEAPFTPTPGGRTHLMTSSVGMQFKRNVGPRLQLSGTAAWRYRSGGDSRQMILPMLDLKKRVGPPRRELNWLEGGMNLLWTVTDRTRLVTRLRGRLNKSPGSEATLGASIRF